VGAPPGTLVADTNASPTAIRLTSISEEGATEKTAATVDDIRAALDSGGRVWVDVTGLADIETISAIGSLFSIDPLALEDVVNTNQRPKVDGYDTHALVVMHMFDGTSGHSKEQVSIVFDKKHVVTFQERPGDCLDPVRKRLAVPHGRFAKRGAAYLVYAILDTILDAYFPMLERIGEHLEEIEDEIAADPDPLDVKRLHSLKRELLIIKRALWPTREMLSALTREEFQLVPRDVARFLRDTYDHAVQLIEMVETYRELATGLYDLYLSSVSTRMNEVMKVLTIVATIFIPLSFLAGVWGMNFNPDASPWNMPELGAYYGYPAALASMLVVGLGLLAFFRWKRWM
jgi:magnesium transporter